MRAIIQGADMPTGLMGRRTMMFSATFPRSIQTLAADFMHEPVSITVGKVGSASGNVLQQCSHVEDEDKPQALKQLLGAFPGLTLVFTETKRNADMLEHYLNGSNTTRPCRLPSSRPPVSQFCSMEPILLLDDVTSSCSPHRGILSRPRLPGHLDPWRPLAAGARERAGSLQVRQNSDPGRDERGGTRPRHQVEETNPRSSNCALPRLCVLFCSVLEDS